MAIVVTVGSLLLGGGGYLAFARHQVQAAPPPTVTRQEPPRVPRPPQAMREMAETARARLAANPPGLNLAPNTVPTLRTTPARVELGRTVVDYALALRDSGARWEEWTPWLRSVEHEPDPIGGEARMILDPQEETARRAFIDGSDGHRERKPRFDEVR